MAGLRQENGLDSILDQNSGGVTKHLGAIADSMDAWEGPVAENLGLTTAEIAAIRMSNSTLNLQTRAALQKWKQKNGSRATYNNLIRAFENAERHDYAETVKQVFYGTGVAAPGPVNQISNNQAEHGTATTNEVTNQVAAPGPVNQISNNQAEHGTATTNEVTNQETPRFSNADVSEIEEENKPQCAPADRQEEIKEYLSKVVVLLHTVKKEELVAVYKYIKPPMNGFENAVKFPLNERMSIVLGKFGNRDAALLQTEKSEECKDKIRVALNRLQNVQLVIGVGFAYGRRGKCEFGDVLVSKVIYGVKTIRVEKYGIKLEGVHVRNDMRRVIEVFATGPMTHKLASVTVGHQRKPKVLADTIMSSIMLVNHPRRVVDVLKHDTRSIGGEMEGKAVADLVLSYLDDTPRREIDFVIIKGVADFGDGTIGKPWQVTASFAAASFAEDKLKKTDFYRLAGGQ